jgi:mRNA interferase RelE/StbE
MAYRIELSRDAERQIERFPPALHARVSAALDALRIDPRPRGVRKLTGFANRWRIRVGDYRIIYEIHDGQLLIIVLEAGHRRDIYHP